MKKSRNGLKEVIFVDSKENNTVDKEFIESIRRIINENKELLEAVGRL